jgi:hypothetical protein
MEATVPEMSDNVDGTIKVLPAFANSSNASM